MGGCFVEYFHGALGALVGCGVHHVWGEYPKLGV